jgi:hypothetical protein
MRATRFLILAAGGVLALGLGACASSEERSAETSTAATTASSPAPAGGATATSSPAATTDATARMGESGQISDAQLAAYARALQYVESAARSQPELSSALQSGDLEGRRQDIEAALRGVQTQSGTVAPVPSGSQATSSTATPDAPTALKVDDFIRIHRQVMQDPSLQARVQSLAGGSGSSSPGAMPSGSPR